jgi:hypothetical protein
MVWGLYRVVHRHGGLVDFGEELAAVIIGGEKESYPQCHLILFQSYFDRRLVAGNARNGRQFAEVE